MSLGVVGVVRRCWCCLLRLLVLFVVVGAAGNCGCLSLLVLLPIAVAVGRCCVLLVMLLFVVDWCCCWCV